MLTQPTDFLRRSPLYRRHMDTGAEFAERDAGAFPDLSQCALADLSLLPRLGVKGWMAWSTLASIGIDRPGENNRASRIRGGGLALRLGDNEALLLGEIAGDSSLLNRAKALPIAPGFYLVPRQDTHAWFVLTGKAVPALLSKVCAIDFRIDRFTDLAIVQTMIARVGAVVVRADFDQAPAFHVLADSASALYLWQVLLQAGEEYSGRAAGFEALRRLTSANQTHVENCAARGGRMR
jgi:sarcosine oxidase subunit gamma